MSFREHDNIDFETLRTFNNCDGNATPTLSSSLTWHIHLKMASSLVVFVGVSDIRNYSIRLHKLQFP